MKLNFLGNNKRDSYSRVIAVLLTITIIALMTGAFSDKYMKKITVVKADHFLGTEETSNYITRSETVGEFLDEVKISIDEFDFVNMNMDEEIEARDKIVIEKGIPVVLNVGGDAKRVGATRTTVGETLDAMGITLDIIDRVEPSLDTEIKENMSINVYRVSIKQISSEVETPYATIEEADATLPQGTRNIKVSGEKGITKINYNVKFENGTEISKEEVSREIVKEPINEVVTVGTKSSGTKILANGETLNFKKKISVTCTAYTATGNRTASGRPAQVGVIAVDPKVIPLGTKLYVESTDDGKTWTYGYCIAGDTGGAIKGKIVDLYYNTKGECIKFGRRSANLYVLD